MPHPSCFFLFFGALFSLAGAKGSGNGIKLSSAVNARTGNQRPISVGDGFEDVEENSGPGRRLQTTTPITELTNDPDRMDMELFIEPGNGTFSPTGARIHCATLICLTEFFFTALSVFVRASDPKASIHYTLDGTAPTLDSPSATFDAPYIHIDTPFGADRRRVLRAIGVVLEVDSEYTISDEVQNHYYVEATDRPDRYQSIHLGVK